jgi:ribose transport system substrate-binding protein
MKNLLKSLLTTLAIFFASTLQADFSKKIAYITSDTSIPFWQIMTRGIEHKSKEFNYEIKVYNSNNSQKKELQNTVAAIEEKVDGIIISPTNSSACVTVLKLAKEANIPVVISDIGADSDEYVSFISSNNYQGAYEIGKILTNKLIEQGNQEGKVGIIAIPQKRLNGQQRTAGFMQALSERSIQGATIKQQVDFSFKETYFLAQELLYDYENLKAIWLQGSDKYKGALQAINEAQKQNDVLLLTFDAEPIFLELIPKGVILASAMQQPFLMGEEALKSLHLFLNNQIPQKNIQLPVLAISKKNIDAMMPIIKRNVLGLKY